MNLRYVGILVVILLVALGFTVMERSKPAVNSVKLQVAASFYPLYFFASQIAGDKAQVMNVTPAGGEPHDYEPTAQDIAQIANAKLLILNGGGLEAWGNKIRQNIDPNHTSIVTAGEGLTT